MTHTAGQQVAERLPEPGTRKTGRGTHPAHRSGAKAPGGAVNIITNKKTWNYLDVSGHLRRRRTPAYGGMKYTSVIGNGVACLQARNNDDVLIYKVDITAARGTKGARVQGKSAMGFFKMSK